MNANQLETWAAQVRESAALLADIQSGLTAAAPHNHDIAASVAAQLGTALLGLRLFADRLELDAVYEPSHPAEVDDDLVDATGPMYAITADQLTAMRTAAFRAGLEAREPVPA
jgi:hypothetical protein